MPGSDDRIPYAVACRHSPLWVTEDLEPHGKVPGMLPENRGIYTQSDSPKKSSRNIWSLAVVSVDQRY